MPYSLFLKSSKILNCPLLQNIGGALKVNTNILFTFQDILENDDIALDEMFICSLVSDLIKVS